MPIVYCIRNKYTNQIIYIGSTIQRLLCMRKGDHKKQAIIKPLPVHKYIEQNGSWDNFIFECLEELEIVDIIDLRKREQYYIDIHSPSQNKVRAFTTHEQFLERKRNSQKIYRLNHKQEYTQAQKESKRNYDKKRIETHINCPCGGTYTLQNKTNHFSRLIHKKYETENNKISKS